MGNTDSLFNNPFKGFNLPSYIYNISYLTPYLIFGVLLLLFIIVIFYGHSTNSNKGNKKRQRRAVSKSEKTVSKKQIKQTFADNRPSLEVIEKITHVERHMPLNEPMQIQVMISGYKAAKEFLFYMNVPSGTKKIGIKKMLYINGKTWARDLYFGDFTIRREKKTGNLMVRDVNKEWRVWHPLHDIQKNGRKERDWVMQFKLMDAKRS